MQINYFSKPLEFVAASASFIKAQCAEGEAIGLSGGKTPLPVYEALASDADFNVETHEFFLVDERYVSLENEDSNYLSIIRAFGPAEPFFSEHLHFFDTGRKLDETIANYREQLAGLPGDKFGLVVLGIGADGHIASLFPNSPALEETVQTSVSTINEKAPNPPVRERLTLTWPVILNAKTILVLLSGAEKKSVLEELQNGTKNANQFPAKRLLGHSNVVVNFLS